MQVVAVPTNSNMKPRLPNARAVTPMASAVSPSAMVIFGDSRIARA